MTFETKAKEFAEALVFSLCMDRPKKRCLALKCLTCVLRCFTPNPKRQALAARLNGGPPFRMTRTRLSCYGPPDFLINPDHAYDKPALSQACL